MTKRGQVLDRHRFVEDPPLLWICLILAGIQYLAWWAMENQHVPERFGWGIMTVCYAAVLVLGTWGILLFIRQLARDLTA